MTSVRPIDRFVSALHREGGEELLIASGTMVRLRAGSVERPLLAQEIRTDQIEGLLKEIVPAEHMRAYKEDGEVNFAYQSPTGMVAIRSRRRNGRMAVAIRPVAQQQQQQVQQRRGREAQPLAIAVGAESATMVMESPLDTVMGGAPVARGGGGAVSALGFVQASPVVEEVDEGPMELAMESVAPPPLPLEALTPIVTEVPTMEVRAQRAAAQRDLTPMPNLGRGGASAVPKAILDRMNAQPPPERAPPPPTITGTGPRPVAVAQIKMQQVAQPAPQPVVEAPAPVPMAFAQPAHVSATHAAPVAAAHTPHVSPQNAAINTILRTLVKEKGSDLHLTANLPPKMRKDGDICGVPGFDEVLSSDTIQAWLMEIAPEASRQRYAQKNDADYAHEIAGCARFRVNAFRDRRGVGGVMRVIPSEILSAEKLNLPQAVTDLCYLEKGLVVVTGPTGSGKSTTLAAMVDLINKTRSDHVITIEDPIEFVHEPRACLVNQREVHMHTESFSAALRAALREDPDIVLVGEMRDLETIAIAIETAETGHLVFGTLHTNTAISTVDRIIDQFPTDRQSQVRVMLSESLRGVVAQTLCKKKGGGRVAALEILIGVPAIANLIREGKTFQMQSILQTGKAQGMQTLNDSLMKHVMAGIVEPAEAFRKAVNRTEMKTLLERAGHKLE